MRQAQFEVKGKPLNTNTQHKYYVGKCVYNLTSEKPIDREKGRELKEKNDENRERERLQIHEPTTNHAAQLTSLVRRLILLRASCFSRYIAILNALSVNLFIVRVYSFRGVNTGSTVGRGL